MLHKTDVLIDILQERDRQDKKWGLQREFTPEKWLVILMEEVGELCKEAQEGNRKYWDVELVQVAAVAFAMIEFGDSLVWPTNSTA